MDDTDPSPRLVLRPRSSTALSSALANALHFRSSSVIFGPKGSIDKPQLPPASASAHPSSSNLYAVEEDPGRQGRLSSYASNSSNDGNARLSRTARLSARLSDDASIAGSTDSFAGEGDTRRGGSGSDTLIVRTVTCVGTLDAAASMKGCVCVGGGWHVMQLIWGLF